MTTNQLRSTHALLFLQTTALSTNSTPVCCWLLYKHSLMVTQAAAPLSFRLSSVSLALEMEPLSIKLLNNHSEAYITVRK